MSAEQIRVVSICARCPDQFQVAKGLIGRSDFVDPYCREVWESIERVAESDPDYGVGFVLLDLMRENQEIAQWLKDNLETTHATSSVETFVAAMIDDVKQHNLKLAIHESLQAQDVDVEQLEKALDEFRSTKQDKSVTFKSALSETMDYLDKASEGETGLLTGIGCIDRQTGGLQEGRILVIAARTGSGKTAITNQICMNVASRKIPVGICSLEMSASELTLRSIAYSCNASLSGLFKADHEALAKMSQGMRAKDIANWPIHFNTDEYRLDKLVNQITVWARRDNIKLAVVDHIGLVEAPDTRSANERISEVTRAMKKLSKRLSIPIILVSQLNRANDKENRAPRLSDLRDSGSIEQDADMVILLHKVMDADGHYVKHEIDIAKNRQGPVGRVAELVTFNGVTQTFIESDNYKDHQASWNR